MARWDDLHRAIEARDMDGAEQIWLELLENDLDAVGRFTEAARALASHSGGKRQAGMLLWMLIEALKEKGRVRPMVPVFVALSEMAPDDGSIRQGLIDAAREAHADRPDLDALFEKSGILGGDAANLPEEAARLERFLDLEPGAYVWHKSGWGAGRIVGYVPEHGRCVIDFKDRKGHEMDIAAAADRLERLDDGDIRAMAISDPKGLRKRATEDPLEMLRQVLARFSGSTKLRHVKDALVPDAIASTRWSAWWKEAKKLAHLDPRYHVGPGRDPVIEHHDTAEVDFATQIERAFRASPTVGAKQKAAREFLLTAGEDEDARRVLAELVSTERQKATKPATIIGWDVLVAALEGRDEHEVLRHAVLGVDDPKALFASIPEDDVRNSAARAYITASEKGGEVLYEAALEQDDPTLAEVGIDRFAAAGHPEYVARLLDRIDAKPAMTPNLYAWYVRGLRRHRWDGRTYDSYTLLVRMLKVIDAVEYRTRRGGTARDKTGVSTLNEVLVAKQGALVKEAAEATDRAGANHLVRVLEQIRGLRGRVLQKVQTIILRTRPHALRKPDQEVEKTADGETVHVGERLDRVYMTAAGMERLKTDRDKILNDDMMENAKEIARAREFGDLSENAEYHAAREKQALLQARADAMGSELARAIPITPDIVQKDRVSVGSRVRVRDAAGQEITYTLLGPPDADVKSGIINYLTPLGQALMGHRQGDHVQVMFEDGSREVEVLDIESALA